MNVIFLDMDGVLVLRDHEIDLSIASEEEKEFLNRTKWKWRLRTLRSIDKRAVLLLEKLAEDTNSKIVLSSDWRRYDSVDDIQQLLNFHSISLEIIGKTPEIEGPRGREIQAWLRDTEFEVDRFVIIDDRDDMDTLKPFLVKTNERQGFTTLTLFEKARKILSK